MSELIMWFQTHTELIRWIIATIIAVATLFIGRYWGLHDRKLKKDQMLLDKIKETLPSDGNTVSYLMCNTFESRLKPSRPDQAVVA